MVKRRVRKQRGSKAFEKRFNFFNREVENVEKEIEHEVKNVEKWIIERRKFFIKLGWTILLIAALWIFSHFFLRVKGVGV